MMYMKAQQKCKSVVSSGKLGRGENISVKEVSGLIFSWIL